MDGAGEELFAGAGFAQEQNGGGGGGGELHLSQRALERGTVADELLESNLAADFFLEVELFLGELVFESLDFLEGQGVFDRDGDLRGDGLKQLDVFRSEGIKPPAREIERSEGMGVMDQRDAADGLKALGAKDANDVRVEAVEFRTPRDQGLAGSNGVASGRSVARNHRLRLEDILLAGKIEGVNPEQTRLGVDEREAGVVVVDDALESVDDAAEKFREFAADDQEVVDFEKDLEAVTLSGELRLIRLGSSEIQGVIDCYGHLACHALHELQLGLRDALRNPAAQTHGAKAGPGGK